MEDLARDLLYGGGEVTKKGSAGFARSLLWRMYERQYGSNGCFASEGKRWACHGSLSAFSGAAWDRQVLQAVLFR